MKARNTVNRAGFTLIELLVVVTIIGIIAAIAIPGLLNALDKSKQVSTLALLRSFSTALEIYNGDNISYPVTNDIYVLIDSLRPFAETLKPRDEWRNELAYQTFVGAEYTIRSHGKDGIPGAYVTPETRYAFELDIGIANGQVIGGVE